METKITYLFGAGASAGNQLLLEDRKNEGKHDEEASGIPVVKNFNEDIGRFLELFKSYEVEIRGTFFKFEPQDLAKKFYKEFNPLYLEFKNLYSYDTFAKKLFETSNDKQLEKLKFLLKAYLIFRQNVTHRDKRYDLFFASLITDGKINPNVNFLSWNYDTQIEMALSSFSRLSENQKNRFLFYIDNPAIGESEDTLKKNSMLIKLNGSISYEITDNIILSRSHTSYIKMSTQKAVENVINVYKKYLDESSSHIIEFSWEKTYKSKTSSIVNDIIANTNILVVIGYSFPTLNRKRDLELLTPLSEHSKIYVQCENNHFESIKTRIKALLPTRSEIFAPNEILNVNSIDEFYIPFELK